MLRVLGVLRVLRVLRVLGPQGSRTLRTLRTLRTMRTLRTLRTPRTLSLSALSTLLLTTSCASAPMATAAVTLAVVNARAWTGDPRRPWADAIAVEGERIAAVGSSAEIRKLAGASARIIDARGMM